MKFSMFRRREAKKVTAVAGVPIHGLERAADGVILHLAIEGETPLVLEVPRATAEEMRDWLRKVTEALDQWERIAGTRNSSGLTDERRTLMPLPIKETRESWGWIEDPTFM